MIKYNNNNIVDWNLSTDNIVKVYRNGNLCYQKMAENITPPTPPTPPTPTTDGKLLLTYESLSTKTNVGYLECSDADREIGQFDIDHTWYSANTAYLGDCDFPTKLNANAFMRLSALTTIYFCKNFTYTSTAPLFAAGKPNNVIFPEDCAITQIGGYMFYNCGFTSITIPSGVTSIGNYAFANSSLRNITCLSTTPPTLGERVFQDTNINAIYVPSASVNAYKAAEGWSDYANRIQAIQ